MLLSKEEFMEIKTELVEGMFDTVNLLFLKSQMIRMALTQYFDWFDLDDSILLNLISPRIVHIIWFHLVCEFMS